MPITLQDVATTAGVSSATVSKVLNKRYDVAPETIALVEQTMATLGYRRGATRRGRPSSNRLRDRQESASLALLITSPRGPVQSAITGFLIDSIEATARERGLHFLVTRMAEDGSLPPCLDPVQVDGLILRSPSRGMTITLPEVPSVWVFKPGWGPAPADLVLPDNEMVGQMAAAYLIERGHRRLAVVNPQPEHPELQMRTDRFRRFALASGATPLVIEEEKLDLGQAAAQLASEMPLVTGLFYPGGNEDLEILHRELQQHGVYPGESVDLISCSEDMARLQALHPRLPCIDIQVSEMGRVATETLLWRIQHPREHRRCILIEPRLVDRRTDVPGR